jgi:hypothetical protein
VNVVYKDLTRCSNSGQLGGLARPQSSRAYTQASQLPPTALLPSLLRASLLPLPWAKSHSLPRPSLNSHPAIKNHLLGLQSLNSDLLQVQLGALGELPRGWPLTILQGPCCCPWRDTGLILGAMQVCPASGEERNSGYLASAPSCGIQPLELQILLLSIEKRPANGTGPGTRRPQTSTGEKRELVTVTVSCICLLSRLVRRRRGSSQV